MKYKTTGHLLILRIFILLLVPALELLQAHPVTYKGALALMSNNSNSMSEHAVNYTLNPNFAVGFKNYRLITSEENTTQYYIGHLNWLVKRWNFDRSQANIYLGGGYGTQQATHQTSNQYYSELKADWENRQYYIDAIYTRLWDQQSRDSDIDIKKLRLGFAPYLADYEDLNTWFILEAIKLTHQDLEVGPLLRFFMKNVLWEIGSTFQGKLKLNLMVHY